MRLLILSDLHLEHKKADILIDLEKPDLIVFLGDLFHHWNSTAAQDREAAVWLKDKLKDPRVVYILGNHDTGTRWYPENQWAFCSGCDELKSQAVREILTEEDWNRTRSHYSIPEYNLLFTHAGLHRSLPTLIARSGLDYPQHLTAQGIGDWLDKVWPSVVLRYRGGAIHPLLESGTDRGGMQHPCGGINWADFRSHEPIPQVSQIVGHTIHEEPLFRFCQGGSGPEVGAPMWRRASLIRQVHPSTLAPWLTGGWSLCMDTQLKHYARLDLNTGSLNLRRLSWDSRGNLRGPSVSECGVTLPRWDEARLAYLPLAEPLGAPVSVPS